MAPTSQSLPQPSLSGNTHGDFKPYKYVRHDLLDKEWLGSARRLQRYLDRSETDDGSSGVNARYQPKTLVWVLLSKGRQHSKFNDSSTCTSLMLHKKRRDKKNKRATEKLLANEGDQNQPGETSANKYCGEINDDEASTDVASEEIRATANSSYGYHSKSEMFLRARVVSDDNPLEDDVSFETRMQRRVLVRYSKGATYRVRAYNLVPVLEQSLQNSKLDEFALHPVVIVTPETHIYRRIVKTHTTPDDSFMEIGCDYGITVDKVRKAMEEAGDVPLEWPNDCGVEESENKGALLQDRAELQNLEEGYHANCLGIDRSQESIGIANERFPQCKFALCNVLKPDEMASLNTSCKQTLKGGAPSVIAIDINGNREIEGVLECLQVVMNEKWIRQPRMIVVKSRFLYWDLKKLHERS